MRDEIGDVKALGRLGLEKLAPRRDVEKEVANLDLGAASEGNVTHLEHPPAADLDLGADHISRRLRAQSDLGDRSNGGQRLAAKAEGGDRFEVFGRFQLAR